MDDARDSRLGREDWIEAGYGAFAEGGVGAVRVDALSRGLKVTRGSFYWHFKSRADLLRAVLERWRDMQTERVIRENEAAGGDARERLMRLLESCASDDGRLEMSIRTWMATDDAARDVVAGVDAERIGYIAALLEGVGLPPGEAARRAPVAYASWLGEYSGAVASDAARRLENIRALFDLVVAR